jgi:hypothetical protein
MSTKKAPVKKVEQVVESEVKPKITSANRKPLAPNMDHTIKV